LRARKGGHRGRKRLKKKRGGSARGLDLVIFKGSWESLTFEESLLTEEESTVYLGRKHGIRKEKIQGH